MPLDPPLQRIADLLAGAGDEPEPTDLDEIRAKANATMLILATERDPAIEVAEHTVAVEGGEIRVRVLTPTDVPAPRPGLLFIHGGGWFQGNLDTAEVECGPLATLAGCVVVSVEYRLAPEHPFPVPLDDCTAAYEWLLGHVDELGIDPARIAFAGTSAGGNLAAALTLVARDRGLPQPLVQLLDAPALDLTLASPSMIEQGSDGGLTRDAVDTYAGYYVGERGDRTHPRVSPLHEPDLTGLAPAVVVVAELDPVRDDGERWVEALHAADVPAACFRVAAQFHGGWVIPLTVTAGLVSDLRASALRRAFAGTLVPDLPF
jgi:acetyl esterase